MEKRSLSRWLGNTKISAIIAAALSLCLMGMMVFQGVQKAQADPTERLDLDAPCTIQVVLSNNGVDAADLPSDLHYNLYKVASVEPLEGYDTYQFTENEDSADGAHNPFATAAMSQAIKSLNDKPTADMYNAFAQDAADIIVTSASTIAPNFVADDAYAPLGDIPAGLYLLVAYTSDAVEDGKLLVGPDEEGKYVSNAFSATKKFTFSPQLIALPTKEADKETGIINTANPGGWITGDQDDPIIVSLKFDYSERKSTLTIHKTVDQLVLNSNSGNNTASFIFEVNGYKADPETTPGQTPVYFNTATIVLDKTTGCSNSCTLTDIDAGLYVVVTEVYTGATYKLVTEGPQTTQIVAPQGGEVSFQNAYEDTGNNGGSVTNSYVHDGVQWSPEPQQSYDHSDAR